MKKKSLFSLIGLFFFLFLARGGWLPTPVRLDTGDPPGAHESWRPQIACSEYRVYTNWSDERNGSYDIYFTALAQPDSDIKANGSDGPISITTSDSLAITLEFNAGTFAGKEADWWILASTPHGFLNQVF